MTRFDVQLGKFKIQLPWIFYSDILKPLELAEL